MGEGAMDAESRQRPMSTRTKEIGAESRQRILDAAEELFGRRGFVETSIADVADLSGISRGSIPWHFKNKAGLLMAVVDRATSRAHALQPPPGLDDIDAFLAALGDYFRQPHMALLHTLLAEASKPESDIRDSYVAYHEHGRTAVASWLATSPTWVVDGLDSDALARLIYSMLVGIHVQWRVAPDRVDLDEALASIVPLLRAAFRSASPSSTHS